MCFFFRYPLHFESTIPVNKLAEPSPKVLNVNNPIAIHTYPCDILSKMSPHKCSASGSNASKDPAKVSTASKET